MDVGKFIQVEASAITVIIREWEAVDFRGEGSATQFVPDFGGKRHGHHSAAVKGVVIGNNGRSSRGLASDLDGVLHALCSGIGEHHFGMVAMREEGGQFFRQLHIQVIGGNIKAAMDKGGGLRGDRFHHWGGAVSGVDHADASGEVDHLFSVSVDDQAAAGAGGGGGIEDADGVRYELFSSF